jgi:hypothetical protein
MATTQNSDVQNCLWAEEVTERGLHRMVTCRYNGEPIMSEAMCNLFGEKETDLWKTMDFAGAPKGEEDSNEGSQSVAPKPKIQPKAITCDGKTFRYILRKKGTNVPQEERTIVQGEANQPSGYRNNAIPQYLVDMYGCRAAINGKDMEITPEKHLKMSNKNWRNILLYRHEVPVEQIYL